MNIAFDFDGTLLDSRQRHVHCLRRVWPSVDETLVSGWESRFWKLKMAGGSTRAFLEKESIDDALRISTSWIQHIEDEDLLRRDVVYPGALACLELLQREHSLYLVTARADIDAACQQISGAGLCPYFDRYGAVASGGGAGQRKTEFLSAIGIECVVGDTESDEEWAKSSSAEFVAVDWGFRDRQFWCERGITPVSSYEALIETLKLFEYEN